MAKGKTSFVLYHDIRKPLELLTDEQRGKLFMAILNYSELDTEPDFDDAAIEIAFAFIRNALDRDTEAWEDKREKRALAGSKGGKQTQVKQANASNEKQNEANQAVPVPVPVPVNVPVPVIEKKKKEKRSFSPPTLEEVRAYCQERKSSVDPDQFYSYFTADPDRQWIDAKGNRVTSWKQKLLTWEKYDKPAAQRKSKTEMYVDSMRNENHRHTPEEMDKLLAAIAKI